MPVQTYRGFHKESNKQAKNNSMKHETAKALETIHQANKSRSPRRHWKNRNAETELGTSFGKNLRLSLGQTDKEMEVERDQRNQGPRT